MASSSSPVTVATITDKLAAFVVNVYEQRIIYRTTATRELVAILNDMALVPAESTKTYKLLRSMRLTLQGLVTALTDRELNKKQFLAEVASLSNILHNLKQSQQATAAKLATAAVQLSPSPVVSLAADRSLAKLDLAAEEKKEIDLIMSRPGLTDAQRKTSLRQTSVKFAEWRRLLGKKPDNPVLTEQIRSQLKISLEQELPIPEVITTPWVGTALKQLDVWVATKQVTADEAEAYKKRIMRSKNFADMAAMTDHVSAKIRSDLQKSLDRIPKRFPDPDSPRITVPYKLCFNFPIALSATATTHTTVAGLLNETTLKEAEIPYVKMMEATVEGRAKVKSYIAGIYCLTQQTVLCINATEATRFFVENDHPLTSDMASPEEIPVAKLVLNYAKHVIDQIYNKINRTSYAIVSQHVVVNKLAPTEHPSYFVWLMPMHTYLEWFSVARVPLSTELHWDVWHFAKK